MRLKLNSFLKLLVKIQAKSKYYITDITVKITLWADPIAMKGRF